jgi:hypothetical protein
MNLLHLTFPKLPFNYASLLGASYLMCCLLGVGHKAMGQNIGKANASWEKKAISLGVIKEESGPVRARFIVRNTGDAPLQLYAAVASCGCTTPTWTQQPIAVGDSGFVDAEYNPLGRPGIFNKTVAVSTNSELAMVELLISGNVIGRKLTVAEEYPHNLALGLAATSGGLDFGTVSPFVDSTARRVLSVIHLKKGPLILSAKLPKGMREWLSWDKASLGRLNAGDKRMLTLNLKGAKSRSFGPVSGMVPLTIKDSTGKEITVRIPFSARIEDYPKVLSAAERNLLGEIAVVERQYDAGTVAKGTTIRKVFVIKNTGKADLKIYAIKPLCSCVLATIEKRKLKPGEETKAYVSVKQLGDLADSLEWIDIYSSDAATPKTSIGVVAHWK